MKKKIAFLLAAGCIGASAASVNYDLLGRKGSKMNSPMVYKNVDYSKIKKNESQKQGSSLKNRSLARASNSHSPGLRDDIEALEGVFNNRSNLLYSNASYPYYLKAWYAANNYSDYVFRGLTSQQGLPGYLNVSNAFFLPVPLERHEPTGLHYGVTTNVPSSAYQLTRSNYSFNNTTQPSPYSYSQYGNTDMITYMPFSNVENDAKRWSIWWYDNPPSGSFEWDDVGIYMSIDALPAKLDPSKSVPYLRLASGEIFEPTPQTEMLSSRTYNILKGATKRSVIFVGSEFPVLPEDHPLNPDHRSPLIYMGVRNRQYGNVDNETSKIYGFESMVVDNGVFESRLVEIVAAGNYNVRANSGHLGLEAHAANAITVGAVDANSKKMTSYNSNQSMYCTLGLNRCNDGNHLRRGSKKPEIYNYSHFYFNKRNNNSEYQNYYNDEKRVYKDRSSGIDYTFNPYYDGSEMAAAYTGALVANLLSANPFYRWHPEVVKALLLSSGHVDINTPYPLNEPATTKIPSYQKMMSDKDHNEYFHESRYWLGSMERLHTHKSGPNNSKKEIRFSVKRPTDKSSFTAAIAWLSSGFDILHTGRVPYDFDLYVYENSSDNVNNINVDNYLARSIDGDNSFEVKEFTTYANYITFRILLWDDYTPSDSEYRGNIALGFDVASNY